MDTPCRIELLGGLRVLQPDGNTVARFATYKTGALLAFLAYHPGRVHPREQLMEMLWADGKPGAARLSLRVALNSLRRQLEPPGTPAGSVLVADRAAAGLNPAAVATDVAAFEAVLHAATNEADPVARARTLQEALALYRGELLSGYYEGWMTGERERLAEAFRGALRALAAAQEQAGDRERALDSALRAVSSDPFCEDTRLCLMRLYAAAGQPDAALRQFRELERLLLDEFGERPSRAARALAEALKEQPQAGPRAVLVRGAPDPAPPAASPPRGRPPGGVRLPLPFTRFFGREEEMARVQGLLCSPQVRLVTLTGPGGSGKTRLAIEIARKAADAFDGAVWFVPLGDLSDPQLIAGAVAGALGLEWSADAEPLEQVVRALGGKGAASGASALLVLDNFEHLVSEGAVVVRTLLERVPALTCLVTSRQALDLAGEQEFPVLPLPTPNHPGTPERLLEFASVQLFVDRAQARRVDFQVTPGNAGAVAALCHRLEGIPLAIELAAAWARTLTAGQMLERLEHRFDLLVSRRKDLSPRHQTLRAAIEWGYQLLAPPLQRFFARLSVFRGGWTLPAAEAVCEEPLALDYLDELRRCSLVLAEEPGAGDRAGDAMRFRLLDALREFGREQLPPEERETLARRHGEWFLRLAEQDEAARGAAPDARFDRLTAEHDNLRAALEWGFARTGGGELMALRLAGALSRFWGAPEYVTEGRRQLERALQNSGGAPPALRAKLLCGAGLLASYQNQLTPARARLEESLAVYRELGDKQSAAEALIHLGRAVTHQDGPAAACLLFEESLAIRRETGDEHAVARSLTHLGASALAAGDAARARSLYEEALAVFRQMGDKSFIAYSLSRLGSVAAFQGDYDLARSRYEESLALQREAGDWHGAAGCLIELGAVAWCQDDLVTARSFYEESLALHRASGNKRGIARALENLGNVAAARADHAPARSLYGESMAISRELGDRCGTVRLLCYLGQLALEQQSYGEARALREEGLAISRESGNRWDVVWSLHSLGEVAAAQKDYALARSLYGEGLAISRELGSKEAIALVLDALGKVTLAAGDADEACSLHEQSLALHRELGRKPGIAESLRNLAAAASRQGDYERAAALHTESLTLTRDMGDRRGIAACLESMARTAAARGHAEQAARLFGAAQVLREAVGIPPSSLERADRERDVAAARAGPDAETFARALAEGQAMTLQQAVAYALGAPS